MMKNIAVFASGNGSNFEAIAKAVKSGKLKAKLALLVCDNDQAFVLKRAKKLKVKTTLIQRENFSTKSEFEKNIIKILKSNAIDLIILAGFMRIIGSDLLSTYKGRIINIHPSLLPSFKGEHGIKDAFEYGVKFTGVTVHFVDYEMDHGPIILQEAVKIEKKDTLNSLEAKIHKIEHKLYPQAIKLFVDGRLKIRGRRVSVA